MSARPADRRAHLRVPAVVREARLIGGKDVFFGYAANVGRGGLFINSPRARSPGEEWEIRFEVPGLGRELRCRARVVWSRRFSPRSPHPPGFGMEFLDLPPADAAAIEAWICGLPPAETPLSVGHGAVAP
ncbi:MAG: PilZ domain-containing protein [Deferrisomatales bacterium]